MLLKSALVFLLLSTARGNECPDGQASVSVTVNNSWRSNMVEFTITDACNDEDGTNILASKAKSDHPESQTTYDHQFCLPGRLFRLNYHDDYGWSSSTSSTFVFRARGREVTGGRPLLADPSLGSNRVEDAVRTVGRVCEDTEVPTTAAPTVSVHPSSVPSVGPSAAPTRRPTQHPTYPPHSATPEAITFELFQFRFTYEPAPVCASASRPYRMPGGWPSECALSCAHLSGCVGFEVFDPPLSEGEGCVMAVAGSDYGCDVGEAPNALFYRRDVSMHFGELAQE